jgi:hypothetical protein
LIDPAGRHHYRGPGPLLRQPLALIFWSERATPAKLISQSFSPIAVALRPSKGNIAIHKAMRYDKNPFALKVFFALLSGSIQIFKTGPELVPPCSNPSLPTGGLE